MQGKKATFEADFDFSSRARPQASRLCRVCTEIDFDRYLGEKIENEIGLGTWVSILRSISCPFCSLVSRCLQADPRLTPKTYDTLVVLSNELSWKLAIEFSPYDRTKSESYSNKYDLRSKAKESPSDAYRFVVYAVDIRDCDENESVKGYIQYLAHKEKDDNEQQFFGRRVDAARVDIDLLCTWLDICSEWHGDECENESSIRESLPSSLRLIDVKKKCIVKSPKGEEYEYVALSYVWGRDEMKRETGMEPAMLFREGINQVDGMESTPLPKRIPKTVDDAISLTRLLGFDTFGWMPFALFKTTRWSKRMKAIYNCASLTIAAAAGSHADYGLPGISVPRKHSQYSQRVDGLRLATMFPSFSQLENSSTLTWNSRGWTFQEKLLSHRILLFTEFQVYFKCSESIWTEEIMIETERLSKSVETRRGKYRWQPKRHVANYKAQRLQVYNPHLHIEDDWDYLGGFKDYTAAIEEYTRRTLTDQKDMLFAIDGVLETMEDTTDGFFSGLPRKHFLESLLWYPKLGTLHTFDAKNKIPSWTWASSAFTGAGISFDLMDVRQLRALVQTSMRSFQGKDKPSGDDSEKKETDDKPTAFALMGTYSNLLASLAWPLLQKDHTITKMYISESESFKRIKYNLPISAFDLKDWDKDRIVPGFIGAAQRYAKANKRGWKPSVDLMPKNKPVLCFETVVVKLRIGRSLYKRLTDHEDEAGIFELLNLDNECVGEVRLTHGRARRRRSEEDFLTISWGLSLQHAEGHPDYLPRWPFNSKAKGNHWFWQGWNSHADEGFKHVLSTDVGFSPMTKYVVQRWGRYMPKDWRLSIEGRKEQHTASELLVEVYGAEKGKIRPRSLWPIVNLILVDWDGSVFRRAGVGKIIMKAWQERWNPPEEVLFA